MLRTGIPFATWLDTDDKVILTAIEVLEAQADRDRQQQQQ